MRSYDEVVRRVESLPRTYMSSRVLGEVAGYPVFGVRVSRDPGLPTVLVNGGTHGDEPAGVESALAFLEADPGRWLDRFQFEVVPCLGPYGYVNNTRENAQGVDVNWAFLREDVPEIRIVRGLIAGRRFEAVVDLHEDWESPGYYLYELVRGRSPVGLEISQRVSRVCPVNTNPKIEGERAEHGVISPDQKATKRRKGEGIPVVLFQDRYTDHLITSETPTEAPMAQRVQAHTVALEAVIEAHAG